jgi:dolichol-phosphate mannosyltransferase
MAQGLMRQSSAHAPDTQPSPRLDRGLVIIPTYCEQASVALILEQILASTQNDILVVDDGSPDGTAETVIGFAEREPRVYLIERPSKLGLGTAYLEGFRWALARDYTHVFEMDADFSHDPATLERLLAASRHADVVIGSRYVPGGRTENWSPLRKAISRGGSLYARTALGLPVADLTSGFKCFRRHVLETIDLSAISSEGYAFQIEMTYHAAKAGHRIVEIPITFSERCAGRSKMSLAIIAEAFTRVWQLRSQSRSSRARAWSPAIPSLDQHPHPNKTPS